MVLYLDKKKNIQKFTNDFVCYLMLFSTWENLVDKYHNINDQGFIDQLNSRKKRIRVLNFDRFVQYSYIENSIDYTKAITYTDDTYEKLLILFGDIIVNDTFVLSDIVTDANGADIPSHDEIDILGTCRRYKLVCQTTLPNIRFVHDMSITLINSRKDNYLVGKLFKNEQEVCVQNKKPYLVAPKELKVKEKSINYDSRYAKIIQQLKKITSKNIQLTYFESRLYNKYIEVNLHNYINDYFNDLYGFRQRFKNVGLFMDSNYKMAVMIVCYNDALYHKLITS
jgi:hypothetical protein